MAPIPPTSAPPLFDYALLDAHRRRALKHFQPDALFLWQMMAEQLLDRLADVQRHHQFPRAAAIGSHHGGLRDMLQGKFGIKHMVQLDALAAGPGLNIRAREECLPLAANSLDLIVSVGSLQWVNDLPGCLRQIFHALKPDGLFVALLPGEASLHELRASLDAAMLANKGGISPRISPMLGLKDAADLMQRAGFSLPVVDINRLDIAYHSPIKLMHDLRQMGQSNALSLRSNMPLTRGILAIMDAYYAAHFAHPEGGYQATLDILTLTGWKPHPSQPKPLARGSATHSLHQVFSSPNAADS